MPISLLASLAALALAAGGASQQAVRDATLSASSPVSESGVLEETLSASGGADALRDAALGTLAPAPEKVVRVTRSFGTVTIDHRAHLARKAHCADCHGKGPVTKIEFTPRLAHDRCIGCHREQKRGPMSCRECHEVKPPPLPSTLQSDGPVAGSSAGRRRANRLLAAGRTHPTASPRTLSSILDLPIGQLSGRKYGILAAV